MSTDEITPAMPKAMLRKRSDPEVRVFASGRGLATITFGSLDCIHLLPRKRYLDAAEGAVIGADLHPRLGEHHAGVGARRDEGGSRRSEERRVGKEGRS